MRRLVVFSERARDTESWRREAGLRREQVSHYNPSDNPHKIRGLSEAHTALVFLTDELPAALLPTLDMYEALGVPEFHRNSVDEIKAWLQG